MSDAELIARLRDWMEHDEGKINDAREKAAARIAALTLERDEAECEKDRLAEINRNLCNSHNILLVDGSNWQARAEAAEAEVTALHAKVARLEGLVNALGIREMVAGWNGEGKDEHYTPHPAGLGVTIKTTCGVVYALDAALTDGGKDG